MVPYSQSVRPTCISNADRITWRAVRTHSVRVSNRRIKYTSGAIGRRRRFNLSGGRRRNCESARFSSLLGELPLLRCSVVIAESSCSRGVMRSQFAPPRWALIRIVFFAHLQVRNCDTSGLSGRCVDNAHLSPGVGGGSVFITFYLQKANILRNSQRRVYVLALGARSRLPLCLSRGPSAGLTF